uniref:Uncharacterized protein n=1 Tax=Oryza punctata TaxID=4537 RepID=A0A0E0KGG2_ORYPU
MPAYMASHRRLSLYSSVSTPNIHCEWDLHESKKLAIMAKSGVITAGTTVSVYTGWGRFRTGGSWCCGSPRWLSPPPRSYLTVIYKGNFRSKDPFKTVCVAREETKKMVVVATASAPIATIIATSVAARPSSNNVAPAPCPTTAGKSVAVLKRIYPEAFYRLALDGCVASSSSWPVPGRRFTVPVVGKWLELAGIEMVDLDPQQLTAAFL